MSDNARVSKSRGRSASETSETPAQEKPARKPAPRQRASASEDDKRFVWDERREAAAWGVAQRVLTAEKIAEDAAISVSTLNRWKQHPDFQARVNENRAKIRSEILTTGIADVAERTARKTRDWHRLQNFIEQRGKTMAKDPELKGHPEVASGFLVKQVKGIGSGENFQEVVFLRTDLGPLKEIRELEMAGAKELGQLGDDDGVAGHGGPAPLDPNVAYGYPLGAAADILEDFLSLIAQGVDPVEHFAQRSRERIAAAEAAKQATIAGAPIQ